MRFSIIHDDRPFFKAPLRFSNGTGTDPDSDEVFLVDTGSGFPLLLRSELDSQLGETSRTDLVGCLVYPMTIQVDGNHIPVLARRYQDLGFEA